MLRVICNEIPDDMVCCFESSCSNPYVVRVTLREVTIGNNDTYFHLPVFIKEATQHSVNILIDVYKCTFDNLEIKLSRAQWNALEQKTYEVLDSFNGGKHK